ncbi:MAG: J domain-containing protein [Desulfobulbus sp.]|nr:MAG: J domain-containing protein [Desulfobulbus sp.]
MYLARHSVRNHIRYSIRETYQDGEVLRSRELLSLGEAPQQFILYSGGTSFAIDDRVTSGLRRAGVEPDPFVLEELFFPFLDPRIRARIESFADRRQHRRWRPLSPRQREQIITQTHEFDRRRAHFLRFGQTDQRRLNSCAVLYRPFSGKSRDELEQYFLAQEQVLRPGEFKRYIYAIFDLQRFFTESYAQTMPEALDEDRMDEFFLCRLCRLDSDQTFWAGMERSERMPEYLLRYLIMYFDYAFPAHDGFQDYLRGFMDSRRRFAPPRSTGRVTLAAAATVFGISRAELTDLGRKELKKLFRKKARELHPDQGGDHERFIALAEAYQDMLRTKAGKP